MYQVGFEWFRTKAEVEFRFRQIVSNTRESQPVSSLHQPFLGELFSALENWSELSGNMKCMTVFANHRGAKFLFVMSRDGYVTRMNMKRAIGLLLPFYRKPRGVTLPAGYVAAARASISIELEAFLLEHGQIEYNCYPDDESATCGACQVEYLPPWTFDNLLFQFTKLNEVDPARVIVRGETEEQAARLDTYTSEKWREYHRRHARLIVTAGRDILANQQGNRLSGGASAWVDLLGGMRNCEN